MPLIIKEYILLFFICSLLGWCMEVLCKLVQFRRFINRGFLIGPYCPIYGFGAVLVTALLSRFADTPLAVLILAMVICGTLEYITSYIMETLFHARWWDYSQKRFNLNGRVCADTLIPFGLMGLLMIYFVKPVLFRWFGAFPESLMDALCWGLITLLVLDTVLSTRVLSKIRHSAASIHGDSTEAITKAVRAKLAQEGALVRRTLRAFPYASLYNAELLRRLKEQHAALRTEIKRSKAKVRQEIRMREEKFHSDVAALKAKQRKK